MISGYDSSSSENDANDAPQKISKGIDMAPSVIADRRFMVSESEFAISRPLGAHDQLVHYNPSAEATLGSLAGPVNPYGAHKRIVHSEAIDEASFDTTLHGKGRKRKLPKHADEQMIVSNDDSDIWATNKYEDDEENNILSEAQKKYLEQVESSREAAIARGHAVQEQKSKSFALFGKDIAEKCSSIFHGTEKVDYQGRSWTLPPSTIRESDGSHACKIPQRLEHTWSGHGKGVQAIEFFPKLGHLLLSGSLDTTCKIWGVYENSNGGNQRGEKRTYAGHSEPIRNIAFNNDGSRFLSASYDKTMLVWDVESGKAIVSMSNNAVPNCGKFYPVDDNLVIAAYSNNIVAQWDLRTGQVVQEYSHHLMSVNTVTFFDNARRFCTTSDDKKLLCWEWGLPVPTAYIQDVLMQSMPITVRHPRNTYIACQSMDNKILTFDIKDDKLKRGRRVFKGHNSAGFACDIDFSPNGKYIISGDSSGKLVFWDANSAKKFRDIKAHESHPCIGARWHPIESSWVATCAWDGSIKLWV